MNSEVNQVPEPDNRDLQSADPIETLEDVELLSEADPRANSPSPSDIWWNDTQTPIDVESEAVEAKPEAIAISDKLTTELDTNVAATHETIEPDEEHWLERETASEEIELEEGDLTEEVQKPELVVNSDTESDSLAVTSSSEAEAIELEKGALETIELGSNEDTSETSSTTESEPELFTDRWLDEPEINSDDAIDSSDSRESLTREIADLERQKALLTAEIKDIQLQKEQLLLQQAKEVRETIGKMVEEGMKELKERKNVLQIDIEKLERRRERISREMRTNFAGVSQDLAVRVQGFKEYLVGSLQDLAVAAEQLELSRIQTEPPLERRERKDKRDSRDRVPQAAPQPLQPQFTESAFAQQTKNIRQLLDRYRTRPDYYGAPWQLRRTFEPIHAEKVQKWFFERGGRGAIESMNSRLQNILIASAIISILHELYGERSRTLVLIDTPEKLGEWRRGLQDCLGISRSDFGSDRGVVLFDSAEVLVQRADRSIQDKLIPLIIIDETEELVNLALLKFPLLLAFASGSKSNAPGYLY